MSVRARPRSAAFAIVITGMAALVVGAIVLTFVHFPIVTAIMDSALFNVETASGSRLTTWVKGAWVFLPAIMLIGLLSWIWVVTRQ